ncbi:MAG: sigma 54-interacting transcriptional regulator, partial [Candidatus Acidiferrum sp.]
MTGSRLALAADDLRLAGAVQSHLKKTLGQPVFQSSLDGIQEHLDHHSDGLLLLAVASTSEAERVYRLVQEIYLQKLPPIIMIVEDAAHVAGPDLDALEPYIAQRLIWPRDAAILTSVVRERASRLREAFGDLDESVQAVIRRRLARQTPSLLPLVERIAIAAAHDVTVLLTGETGTGKTFVARLMHECSPRRAHPFLTVP